MQGELAMWLQHRGAARATLQRRPEAVADLERGLASSPRDWIRGRMHAQLGDLALAAVDVAGARQQLESAVQYSGRGGNQVLAKSAGQKLKTLPRHDRSTRDSNSRPP